MKTKLFVSFAAFVAASALMCSCSNEESADSNNNSNSNGQLTAFTGGIVTEAPMERMQLSTPEISTEVPDFLTRISMNREKIGDKGDFYWEPKDVIYVEDDKGKLCKSQNEITESAPRTTFLVDGSYTVNGKYDVYYYGTNTNTSAEGKKVVVIANNQTQVAFNNTEHFGVAGDCGVAKAEKATVGYKFDLEHKASYLCFLPYMTSEEQRKNYKIKSIEITSKADNISGTYDLSQDGLFGTGKSNKITLKVGADGNGLELADKSTATTSIKNSLYVVIAPGKRKLSVKYTVFSVKDNKDLTLTKNYPSHNFAVNQICDIPVNLGYAYLYSGYNYYMWDAKENYWSGHEWDSVDNPWQPIDGKRHSGYPESSNDARWYHEGVAFDDFQNPLFKDLPNSQELAWYVSKGDPHWDKDKTWTAFGKKCKGGIWLKKLSVIADKVGKPLPKLRQDYPDDVDKTGNSYGKSVTIISGKPVNIKDYFFLPALGFWYDKGTFQGLGSLGVYWSSTPDPVDEKRAYSMFFTSTELKFGNATNRDNGCVAQPFE